MIPVYARHHHHELSSLRCSLSDAGFTGSLPFTLLQTEVETMATTLEPGILEPGLIVREDRLKILLGVEQWKTLKTHLLERVGVTGVLLGRHRWYSTTHLCEGLARLALDNDDPDHRLSPAAKE